MKRAIEFICDSTIDAAVSKITGKSVGEHVIDGVQKVPEITESLKEHAIDGVQKAFENDKKYFEETHKTVLESKTYEPWMTEELDSGPQPCSIF